MEFDIVISHKGCPDGLSAVWCYYHYLRSIASKFVPSYYEMQPGEYLDLDYTNKKVLLLDICFKLEDLVRTSKLAENITVLDHHKSNYYPDLNISNITFVFDMGRSGAQISWDFFFPTQKDNRPWFIDMIADRDLWKWELVDSEEITTGMYFNGLYKNEGFDKLLLYVDSDIRKLKLEGRTIMKMNKSKVEYLAKQALLVTFDEYHLYKILRKLPNSNQQKLVEFSKYKVYIVNAEHSIASELGNMLSKKTECDFAIVYRYDLMTNQWFLSCRKSKENIDLSVLTKKFGGGGHPAASGFSLPNIGDFKKYFRLDL